MSVYWGGGWGGCHPQATGGMGRDLSSNGPVTPLPKRHERAQTDQRRAGHTGKTNASGRRPAVIQKEREKENRWGSCNTADPRYGAASTSSARPDCALRYIASMVRTARSPTVASAALKNGPPRQPLMKACSDSGPYPSSWRFS